MALNLVISRHLLLQVKLLISSSVEGKKQTKKFLAGKLHRNKVGNSEASLGKSEHMPIAHGHTASSWQGTRDS